MPAVMPAGLTLIVAVAGVLDPPAATCSHEAPLVAVKAAAGLLESERDWDAGTEPPNW